MSADMVAEAIAIASTHQPTEEMIFQALFIAEDPEIADAIWRVHGADGFRPLDPFGANASGSWRATGLEPEDTRRLFGYMRRAHEDAFSGNPLDALVIALNSNTPGIVDEVLEAASPSAGDIVRTLLRVPLPSKHSLEMAERFVELLSPVATHRTGDWVRVVQAALQSHSAKDLALFAKIGVDMTSYALDLRGQCSTLYHPFLERCASNHGRLSLMRDIPDPAAILKAPPAFVETMLRDLSFPAPTDAKAKEADPCQS